MVSRLTPRGLGYLNYGPECVCEKHTFLTDVVSSKIFIDPSMEKTFYSNNQRVLLMK